MNEYPKNKLPVFGKINIALVWLIAFPISFLSVGTKLKEVVDNGAYSFLSALDLFRMEFTFSLFLFLLCAALLLKTPKNNNGFRVFFVLFLIPILFLSAQLTFVEYFFGRALSYGGSVYFVYGLDLPHLNPTSIWLGIILTPLLLLTAVTALKRRQIYRIGQDTLKSRFDKYACFSFLFLIIALTPTIQNELSKSRAYNSLAYLYVTAFESHSDAKNFDHSTWTPIKIAHPPIALLQSENKRNVVFIALESTRASATSLYGQPHGDITPFLNSLSASSFVAEQAITVLPHTSKAVVAITCGVEPFLNQAIFESTLGVPTKCLPDILGDNGYQTVFFQSATETFENRAALIKNLGFNEFYPMEAFPKDGFEMVNYFSYEDKIMLPLSQKWLQENNKPFFAFYLTGTTHHEYKPPSTFPIENYSTNPDFNYYLNSVRYIDDFTRKLFDQYKSAGLYEDTIFVVVGDHGQGFGEHGLKFHSAIPFKEGLQVPLLIHSKESRLNPTRIKEVVSQKDIVATVVELLGMTITEGKNGKSMLEEGERVAYSSCWYDFECLVRTDRNYVYQHYFDHKPDQLYALENDPQEKINVADKNPELINKFRSETMAWYLGVNSKYHNLYSSIDKDYLSKISDTMSFGFVEVVKQYKSLHPKNEPAH